MDTWKRANPNANQPSCKPHAVLGAGNVSSAIWAVKESSEHVRFQFNVFQMDPQTGEVTQHFAVSDIPDLVRLAQVLALAISAEENLETELREDLSCLAACLDQVLPLHILPSPVLQGGVYQALRNVLDYLLEDEQRHFADHPSGRHIYRSLLLIESWLAKTSQEACKESR